MNKTLVIILLINFISQIGYSQLKSFGLNAGPSFSIFDSDIDQLDTYTINSYFVSVESNFHLIRKIYLNPELSYQRKGGGFNVKLYPDGNIKQTDKLDYLMGVFFMEWKTGSKFIFKIDIGSYFSILTKSVLYNSVYRNKTFLKSEINNTYNDHKKMDYGFSLRTGCELKFTKKISTEVCFKFDQGLLNQMKDPLEDFEDNYQRNRSYILSLGINYYLSD